MIMTTENTPTAPAGAPDPVVKDATGYMDAEDALAAELGFPGEEGNATQDTVPETTDDDANDGADDHASDDLDNGLENDQEHDDENEDDAAGDDDSDEDEEDENDSEDEEDENADDSKDPFSSIPKEHHEAVGKLLSKAKQKERSKSERKIAELEAQAATAEKVPDLEAQLESVKAQKVVPAPSADSPYADVMQVEDLGNIESRLWDLKMQLTERPETYKVADAEADGGERYATDEEVRRAQALVDVRLQRDLPRRREWLAKHTDADGLLRADLPELDDPKSELHQAVNKVLASVPGLKTAPGYRKAALSQVLGEKLLEAKGKDTWKFVQRLVDAGESGKGKAESGKKKTPQKKAPPAPPRSKSAPKRPVSKSPGRGGSQDAVWAEIES